MYVGGKSTRPCILVHITSLSKMMSCTAMVMLPDIPTYITLILLTRSQTTYLDDLCLAQLSSVSNSRDPMLS